MKDIVGEYAEVPTGKLRLSHRRRRVAARAVAARRRLRRDGRPAHDDARLRALRRAAPDGLAGAKRPRRRPGAPGDLARDAAAGDDLAAQRPRENPRRRTDALRRRLRPAVDARPPGRGERRPQWRIVRLRQQFRILPRPRRRGDLLCQSHLRRHRRRQRPGRCHAPRKDPPAAALGARLLDPPDARGPDRHSRAILGTRTRQSDCRRKLLPRSLARRLAQAGPRHSRQGRPHPVDRRTDRREPAAREFPLVGERGRVDVTFTLTPEKDPRGQELSLTFVAPP